MSRMSPTSSANTLPISSPIPQRNKESQRSAGPVLCFSRRGYAAFPFSFPAPSAVAGEGAMERREAPGACEAPYGLCESPFRAPIKAGLRGLPWDARPLRRKGLRLPALHQPTPDSLPGIGPEGVGLISDPTLRPAPPASRFMRAAGGSAWRHGIGIISLGIKSSVPACAAGGRRQHPQTASQIDELFAQTDSAECFAPYVSEFASKGATCRP
jgi:hypothetical protein